MSSDPLGEPDREVLGEQPSQFRLIQLLGVMTTIGIVCAIFAPLFRALSTDQATTALILVAIQLGTGTGAFFVLNHRRRQLTRQSGPRLGQSFTGSAELQKLISILVIGTMLAGSLAMVYLSIMQSSDDLGKQPLGMVYVNFVAVMFSVPFLLHIYWRRHLGVIEFFENGVALTPMKFTPWKLVEVHPHAEKENGIQLLVIIPGRYPRQMPIIAQIKTPLRDYLLQNHATPNRPTPQERAAEQTSSNS